MANNSCIGINGVSRKIKKIYVGVNGVAREAKAVSIGVNGVARKCYAGTTTWKKYQAVGYYHYLGGYTKLSDTTRYLGRYFPFHEGDAFNNIPDGRFTGKDYVANNKRYVYMSKTYSVGNGVFNLGDYTSVGAFELDTGHTSLNTFSGTIYAVSQDSRYLAEMTDRCQQTMTEHYGDPYWLDVEVQRCAAVYKINDEYRYKAGTYIGEVESDNETAYPDNGRHTDGYYYVKQN